MALKVLTLLVPLGFLEFAYFLQHLIDDLQSFQIIQKPVYEETQESKH